MPNGFQFDSSFVRTDNCSQVIIACCNYRFMHSHVWCRERETGGERETERREGDRGREGERDERY